MDEWSKKKKASKNGGRGMCKFIDYEEEKRLSRLRNIRGSINQSMQHNSWQASQLEKRRKEQIRQRKREAKKRTEKKGFQVDTGCAATPYEFTKCGLKLRLDKSSCAAPPAKEKSRTVAKNRVDPPVVVNKSLPLVSQYAIDSMELNRRNKPMPTRKNPMKPKEEVKVKSKKKKDINTKSNIMQRQVEESKVTLVRESVTSSISSSSSSSSRSSEGKENGDNQLTEGKAVPLQKKKTKKKSNDSYFMDFDSLKREHADAIEMLKQLDEENKRLFGKKDGGGLDTDSSKEQDDVNEDAIDEPLDVTLPEGMLQATHLSISLHDFDVDDDYLHLYDGREESKCPKPNEDDESEHSCTHSSRSTTQDEGKEEDVHFNYLLLPLRRR